ncbi:MAG: HNH endonuclease signature motif containing protein, partial [Dietzia sp.]
CGDVPGHTAHPATADAADAADPEDDAAAGAAGGRAPVLRPKVTVIATGQTGRDQDGVRVEFTRTGEAALATLLEMLATCDGASVEQVDPTIGAADQPGAELKYRPGAELARRVRLRDGTCRHPGCTVPAEDCDLDHVVPFDHADPARGGLTVETNLMAECRRHHRFKTFSDWRYRLEPDGTLIITTPDGATMITRPEGPLAQYRREQQRAEADAWARQQRRNPHPHTDPAAATEQATYFTRRAQRLTRERTQAATAPGSPTTSPAPAPAAPKGVGPADDSRWWQRNKPHHSTLEHAIRQALLEHLEKQLDQQLEPPPPF